MIELKSLTKEFEEKGKGRRSASNGVFRAVDGLSLKVEPGEIYGLLGSNGAGKTTTLRMLATMLSPTSGTAEVAGFDIVNQPEQVRRSIGVLFGGDTGLYDRLTARENIEYFARLYDMEESQIKRRVEELSAVFEMGDYIDARCAKFSRGMKQKTAFARSIVHSPSVMLFDEPTAGLDISAALEVQNFILSCKKEGKTIILSSHYMNEVEKLCDRVGIISRGQLADSGAISELTAKYGQTDMEGVFLLLTSEDNKGGAAK